jgi:hypothetical protein
MMKLHKLRQVMMRAVEVVLALNPGLAAIAKTAQDQGMEEIDVKVALALAIVECYSPSETEGTGSGDPKKDIADCFKLELRRQCRRPS